MSDTPLLSPDIVAALSLANGEPDALQRLASVLRSCEPMGSVLREVLADALTGGTKSGVRLEMKKSASKAKQPGSLRAKKEALTIGQWMHEQTAGGMTREAAIREAAKYFRVSPDKADKALIAFDKARPWLSGQRTFLKRHNTEWSDAKLFAAFHHTSRLSPVTKSLGAKPGQPEPGAGS